MSRAAIHVFSGPTVPRRRITEVLPGAQVHGPVAHLDVLRLEVKPGDAVAIIDGVFLQSAPVRHKELLQLLEEGVEVWGAASMGALRAAELEPYGMRGVGLVYRLFQAGVLDRDDEVAVAHLNADDDYRAVSVSLVAMRVAARRARRAAIIGRDSELALIRAGEGLPFRDRHAGLIARHAATAGADKAECEQFVSLMTGPEWDVKRQDAERLLQILSARDAYKPAPPTRTAHRHTRHQRRWADLTTGVPIGGTFVTDASALAFCQAFAADYSAFHRQMALREIAGAEPGDASPRELEDAAIANARARGYLPPGTGLHPALNWWLTEAERSGGRREAEIRAIVRSFRFRPGLDPGAAALDLLRERPAFRDAQEYVATAQRLSQSLADRDSRFVPANISVSRVTETFRERWDITGTPAELRAAYFDRGFASKGHFLRLVRPFVAYANIATVPDLRVGGASLTDSGYAIQLPPQRTSRPSK